MDSDGHLCYNQQHVAIIKNEYDDRGLVTNIWYYGTDNQPCTNINGYFHERMSYNQQGFWTDVSYYNINDLPVENSMGFHHLRAKYDSTGRRIVELRSYNIDNMPLPCIMLNGAACIKMGYEGSSKWVSEISFYSIENKPVDLGIGSKIRCGRDAYGQITTFKYYDENGELSSDLNHCAIMELEYNNMGMETDRRYYDENRKPFLIYGIFHISRSYTKTGQLEAVCLYDSMQHLRLGTEGWAKQKFSYINCSLSTKSFYGENDEPIEIQGVYKYVYDIDDCGYIISQSTYDKYMQPTKEPQTGAHKVVNLYDENRRNTGRDYYDTTNTTPFACIRLKYNQRGLQMEQTAYNGKKELVESPLNLGVAKIQSIYDSQDRVTYFCGTSKSGEKMNTSYGYAEAFFSYEKNMQEAVFLDSQKKLINYGNDANAFAYKILYMTDTGQRLYNILLRRTSENSIDTIREDNCYDLQ